MPPPSNDIMEKDKIDEIEPAIENSDQSTNILSISQEISKKLSENQAFAIMSTPETTSKQSIDFDDSASQNQKRHSSQISANAITMNTKSRTQRQTHATILGIISDFISYYSAFAVGLKKSKNSKSTLRLHRDSLFVESRHWHQMLKHQFFQEFQLAASKEMKKLKKRSTYQIIKKKSQNQFKLPFIWVFKYKFNTDGFLIKFKAQLYVRKDLQTTYKETYAAILTVKTFRAIMTIAAAFDLKMHQFDAINAFINSWLDEEIFCKSSEGFKQLSKCWKLFRMLYGLKQAPMLWYKELTMTLKDLRLMFIFGVKCFYANDWRILFFYVDDIVVQSMKQNIDKLEDFEKTLLMKFEMWAFGEIN